MTPLMLLVAVLLMSGVYVSGQVVPKCDPSTVGDISKYYKNGVIPQDILGELIKYGPCSWVTLPPNFATCMTGQAKCVGCHITPDRKYAVITKKADAGSMSTQYQVYEKDGCIYYMSDTDLQPKNKMYVVYWKCGVAVTITCCDTCDSTGGSVGILVCDKVKDMPETKAALTEAMEKFSYFFSDNKHVNLQYCSA